VPRFAANLSLLFSELPLLERFGAAAAAGFQAVELQFPYAFPAKVLAMQLQQHHLQMVLHNLPAGNWDAGERGIACDPARTDEFRAGVELALAYALVLKVPRINCLAGIPPPGISPDVALATLIANLRFAAQQLQPHGLTLLLEAINTIDIPGFFVCHSRQAFDIIAACRQPNLLMQYDIYHMHRMNEAIHTDLSTQLTHIGHIQIADAPGRGEPGTGGIDFHPLFDLLNGLSYPGWIGCEYHPQKDTLSGLNWRQKFIRHS
jgi:hydroxypyruvate isomerase